MTRDIRKRLARALEKGDLKSAGSGVGDEMRRRLDRALVGNGRPVADDRSDSDVPLPHVYAIDRLTDVATAGTPREQMARLPGEELTTPFGNVLQRKWSVPLDELASVQDLDEATAGSAVLAELLDDPTLAELNPNGALYLDTETTGLAGGTGTYVFLLGLGWVEEDAFVVEQLFIRDFTEEAALLHRAGELADRFDVLVSFNGQRYDLPLLDTRRVMNRLEAEFGARPHLDLLKPARLLYSGRFENCRLQTLEKELLGRFRDDDIPGAAIPGLYFDYLAGENPLALLPIFEHNFLDVVTLLTLTAHFLHLSLQPERDPRALGGMGRLHERRGNREQARILLEAARRRRAATYRDLRELGYLYKRQGEDRKALNIWKALITRQEKSEPEPALDATPYIEAAKHFEHRVRDFERALQMTTTAIDRVSVVSGNGSGTSVRRQLDHRADRLRRRLNAEQRTDN